MENYIADDRNVLEHCRMIRNMTDEEFEAYIAKLKAENSGDDDGDSSKEEKTA